MQKIPSVFKRDYEGTRLVYNEVVEGCEWALTDKAMATVKLDGTACLWQDGTLYKRYDRKVSRSAKKRGAPYAISDFKPAPDGWVAAEPEPNQHTGHWPGWLKVDPEDPADKWHVEALSVFDKGSIEGTYELIGLKVQDNPYGYLYSHRLLKHGHVLMDTPPLTTFEAVREYLQSVIVEGIVFYHANDFLYYNPYGFVPCVSRPRMAKIKRKDFGLEWPVIAEWMQSTEDK